MSMKRLVAVSGVVLLISCGERKPEVPRELEQGVKVVEWMLAPVNLSKSSFPAVLPDGTPKEYVSWFFSEMGVAEWPFPDDIPEGMAISIPTMPKGVGFRHSEADTDGGRQIVLRWDNQKWVIIVEAYDDPAQPPLVVREIRLEKVTADQLARLSAEGNIQLGMKYQSF
jgi:hypothetical protein